MLIFDLEANGLTPDKIYCLASMDLDERVIDTQILYLNMKNKLANADVLIGHNITRYDIPVLERILKIKIKAELVDTLALSWYLYPNRVRHGLAEWGEEFGVPKPKIDDWDNLSVEEYVHRCEEDVRINTLLWDKMWTDLSIMYDTEGEVWRLIRYLQFKMDCAREQERSGWKLDEELCKTSLVPMAVEYDKKYKALKEVMPNVLIKKKHARPAKPFKKDGTQSVTGVKWFNRLEEKSLPKDYAGIIEYIGGYKEANPASSDQVKEWLYGLGWVPTSFKFVRDKDDFKGGLRKIPQVRIDGEGGKELCPSVVMLIEKSKEVALLQGVTVLTHRMSILKGFLKSVDDKGYVKAEIQGLTNTLRFKHKTVVNLPGVDKAYGDIVRGCLIAPEGYKLMGSDMSGLEDRTKQHYIYEYDPEYVNEMNKPGFDPHLDIAVLAGMLTPEQVEDHKSGRQKYSGVRHKAKTVNYSATYGAGAARVARETGITLAEATALLETYWQRNRSITRVADSLIIKVIGKQRWLFNPVSKFWYSLRSDKDKFSTLNQGTGTYVFDCWVREVRKVRSQLTAQFHDEIVSCIKLGYRAEGERLLRSAIKRVNERLKLNKEMDIDVQFGSNYAEIH